MEALQIRRPRCPAVVHGSLRRPRSRIPKDATDDIFNSRSVRLKGFTLQQVLHPAFDFCHTRRAKMRR
jgi:hypothetical protein